MKMEKRWSFVAAVLILAMLLSACSALGAAPNSPADLTVTAHGEGSVLVSWEEAADAESYDVEYYSRAAGEWKSDSDYVSGTSYVSTGLTDYESYKFRIRAVNNYGCSDWVTVTYEVPTPVPAHYIQSLSEMTDEDVVYFEQLVEDSIIAYAAKYNGKSETLQPPEYLGTYLLVKKSDDFDGNNNRLGVIHFITVDRYSESAGIDDSISYYYIQEYHDLFMDEDGQIEVNISDYRSASSIDHFFYPDGIYMYEGYLTLEEIEEEWVLSNVDIYSCYTTPGLFD